MHVVRGILRRSVWRGTSCIQQEKKKKNIVKEDVDAPKAASTEKPAKKEPLKDTPTQKSNPEKPVKASLKSNKSKYDVIKHLKKFHALLSIHDDLMLSYDLRESLIFALQSHGAYVAEVKPDEPVDCIATIVFAEKEIHADASHNQSL